MPPLESQGNRPLKMNFEDQLKALVYFHLEEHVSAQHLLQVLEENDFAREHIAPKGGIKKSSFAEAINERGLEQFMHVYQGLQDQAAQTLPSKHSELDNLVECMTIDFFPRGEKILEQDGPPSEFLYVIKKGGAKGSKGDVSFMLGQVRLICKKKGQRDTKGSGVAVYPEGCAVRGELYKTYDKAYELAVAFNSKVFDKRSLDEVRVCHLDSPIYMKDASGKGNLTFLWPVRLRDCGRPVPLTSSGRWVRVSSVVADKVRLDPSDSRE